MKTISRNLILFSAILFILTLLFRYLLSSMLQNEQFTTVWIAVAFYAVFVFILGWIFGKKDKLYLPLYDIGFRFHLATYIICNGIAEVWYLFGFQSDYEQLRSVHLTVVYWGLGLLLHFILFQITRKNAIKGIKKTELFE